MEQTGINAAAGLDLRTYTDWLTEIEQQPAWRAKADREMDYYAGNQLDAEVLQRQRELGIPPAIEPLIGPTIDAVLGAEVKARLDFRVVAEGKNDEIAQALGVELSQAERRSKADRACADAYSSQVSVGIGWAEVGRNRDPFDDPYRCRAIHRNEIWWDWLSREPDLSDARYLVRRKWMNRDQAALMFPEQAELISHAGSAWHNIDLSSFVRDGGQSTDLAMSWDQERGWSIEEMEWRDITNRRVCLFEVWYRVWERVEVMRLPDGRVIEVDKENPDHQQAVRIFPVEAAVVPRVRLSWWLGPHKLFDGPTPYKHRHFPYVPFWGKREDRTAKPFGLIRGMMYLQDEVNARVAKMQWGLSAIRTERTAGAVAMSDDEFHHEVGRPDADIVLDHNKMQNGGVFKVHRDFELNQQQFSRLMDCREGIKRCGGVYSAFMGQDGQASSGVAISSLVEQSSQTLADINDNFRFARAQVGELLLSMVIEDWAEHKDVEIPAGVSREAKIVPLTRGDVQRIRAKVELTDVPQTPTYKAQQLQALTNVTANMPPQLQAIALPHLLSLTDIPDKQEIIEAIKQTQQQPTPEQIEQMILQRVQQALLEKLTAQKDRELTIKESLASKDVIKKGVEAAMAAMQAGAIVAQNPSVAPVGDALLDYAASPDQSGGLSA